MNEERTDLSPAPLEWYYNVHGKSEETHQGLHESNPMYLTIQRKWWLRDYENVSNLLCMLQSLWLVEKGHGHDCHYSITSFDIHDIRSLECDL